MSKFLDQTGLARVRDWIKTNFATKTAFGGASANQNGSSGLVPAPTAGDQDKVLGADGTWKTVSGGGGSYSDFTGATSSDDGAHGLVPAPEAYGNLSSSTTSSGIFYNGLPVLGADGEWKNLQARWSFTTNSANVTSIVRVEQSNAYSPSRGQITARRVLWENAGYSSNFGAQTINLHYDVNNYLFWVIECNLSTSVTNEKASFIAIGRHGIRLGFPGTGGNSSKGNSRSATVNETGLSITFGDNYYNGTKTNQNLIPLRIIGCFEIYYAYYS